MQCAVEGVLQKQNKKQELRHIQPMQCHPVVLRSTMTATAKANRYWILSAALLHGKGLWLKGTDREQHEKLQFTTSQAQCHKLSCNPIQTLTTSTLNEFAGPVWANYVVGCVHPKLAKAQVAKMGYAWHKSSSRDLLQTSELHRLKMESCDRATASKTK